MEVPITATALVAHSSRLGLPRITCGTQSSFKNRMSASVQLKPSESHEKWQQLVKW